MIKRFVKKWCFWLDLMFFDVNYNYNCWNDEDVTGGHNTLMIRGTTSDLKTWLNDHL